ncbi:MAG: ATP-binding cassette domain-containing protein [Betaproteobacteria bacterium]|nr:ATP-binding cassette domain-containing protein [Betaproteobacteria bacterium]
MYLSLRGISKAFAGVAALDGVSLDVDEGEFVCFLGPSGCGKTTLLRIIAGLETPDAAEIRLNGGNLLEVPARARNFGIVFQSYSLFPNMTVTRNIAYGLECRKWPAGGIPARVAEMLALVNLADQAGKYPHQLSGGQQQRIALARALAPKPVMLLLDEPLSALDAKVREELRGEIKDLQSRLGITTIMVTHDQHEAMEVADRIVVMNRGRIEQEGRPVDLYERPANRFVAEFIGRMNVLRGVHGHAAAGIRPEQVELVAGAATPDCWTGRVERCLFLGSITRVTLGLDNLDGQRVTIELQGRRDDLAPGMALAVRLPPAALLRFDDPN